VEGEVCLFLGKMRDFDASKQWVILVPEGLETPAGDLARCIRLLRRQAGLPRILPQLTAAEGNAPSEETPIILLNNEGRSAECNGFSWRASVNRVEILGESARGLTRGIYMFLAALGFVWPAPGKESIPGARADPLFPLNPGGDYQPSHYEAGPPAWKRFPAGRWGALSGNSKRREMLVVWAARQGYDALVFPLKLFRSTLPAQKRLHEYKKAAARYAIAIEAGGREFSSLVPRRYFLIHRDMFRMEGGRRKIDCNFCPTSPDSLRVLKKKAEKYFSAALAQGVKTFHLWPDAPPAGRETSWCACPACRAFSPAEQNRMVCNIAADVLAALEPEAKISILESAAEYEEESPRIPLRSNIFLMDS
jgi:hypothetical protein